MAEGLIAEQRIEIRFEAAEEGKEEETPVIRCRELGPDFFLPAFCGSEKALAVIERSSSERFDYLILSHGYLVIFDDAVVLHITESFAIVDFLRPVIQQCEDAGVRIVFFQYARPEVRTVDEPLSPKRNSVAPSTWDSDVAQFRDFFKEGKSFVFGSLEGPRWTTFLYRTADTVADAMPRQTFCVSLGGARKGALPSNGEVAVTSAATALFDGPSLLIKHADSDRAVAVLADGLHYSVLSIENSRGGVRRIFLETNAVSLEYQGVLLRCVEMFEPEKIAAIIFREDIAPGSEGTRFFPTSVPDYYLLNTTNNSFRSFHQMGFAAFQRDKPLRRSNRPRALSDLWLLKDRVMQRMESLQHSLPDEEPPTTETEVVEAGVRALLLEGGVEAVGPSDEDFEEAISKIMAREELEEAFSIVDAQEALKSLKEWYRILKLVRPYVSLRSTLVDPFLLRLLSSFGCALHCVDELHVKAVLEFGIVTSSIIYDSPFKSTSQLQCVYEHGVRLVTVSSCLEMHSVKACADSSRLLLRVSPNGDDNSALDSVEDMLNTAGELGLAVSGVSLRSSRFPAEDLDSLREELKRASQLLRQVLGKTDDSLAIVDLGDRLSRIVAQDIDVIELQALVDFSFPRSQVSLLGDITPFAIKNSVTVGVPVLASSVGEIKNEEGQMEKVVEVEVSGGFIRNTRAPSPSFEEGDLVHTVACLSRSHSSLKDAAEEDDTVLVRASAFVGGGKKHLVWEGRTRPVKEGDVLVFTAEDNVETCASVDTLRVGSVNGHEESDEPENEDAAVENLSKTVSCSIPDEQLRESEVFEVAKEAVALLPPVRDHLTAEL